MSSHGFSCLHNKPYTAQNHVSVLWQYHHGIVRFHFHVTQPLVTRAMNIVWTFKVLKPAVVQPPTGYSANPSALHQIICKYIMEIYELLFHLVKVICKKCILLFLCSAGWHAIIGISKSQHAVGQSIGSWPIAECSEGNASESPAIFRTHSPNHAVGHN